MRRRLLYFGFCVLIVFGCVYQQKEKFINPIKPPPSTIKVSVDVLDSSFKDPYQLIFLTDFKFSVDSTNNPILFYQVLLDNVIVQEYSLNGNQLVFTLDPCQIQNGNHTVKIQLKIGTNSGSMADKLNAEYYSIEKTFTVVVDHDPPTSSEPISFTMENGFLKLEWQKPNKTNFQYRIVHFSYDLSLGGDTVLTDPTLNTYIDKGYVGGKVTYWIYAFNACSFDPTLVAAVSEIDITPTVFKFSFDPNFSETVSWDQSLINFTGATVKFQGLFGSSEALFSVGKIVGDTIPFGDYDAVSMTIQRKNSPTYKYAYPFSQYPYGRYLFNRPKNFPQFTSFATTKAPSIFVSTGLGSDLFRINVNTLQKEDSITGHLPSFGFLGSILQVSISNDGSAGVMMSNSGKLVVFNPYDLSSFTIVDFPESMLGGEDLGKIGNITNNKLIGINYPYGYNARVAAIRDLNSNENIWSDTLSNDRWDVPLLSEDGAYFAIKSSSNTETNIFKMVNDMWTFLGKVPSGTFFFFRNHLTTELIVGATPVHVYNVETSTDPNGYFLANRSMIFNLEQNQTLLNLGYDDLTQNIYFEAQTVLPEVIYESEVKVFDVRDFSYKGHGFAYGGVSHLYSNGFHFSGNGFTEKIK